MPTVSSGSVESDLGTCLEAHMALQLLPYAFVRYSHVDAATLTAGALLRPVLARHA